MRDEQYPQGDRLGSNGGRQIPGFGSTPGAFGPFAPAGGAPPAIAHGSAESRDMAQQSQTDAHGDDGSRSLVAGATAGWAADGQQLASQPAADGMQQLVEAAQVLRTSRIATHRASVGDTSVTHRRMR